jgi:hypothetical protein
VFRDAFQPAETPVGSPNLVGIQANEYGRFPQSALFWEVCHALASEIAIISHFAEFCGGREERANYPHRVGGEFRDARMFIGFARIKNQPTPDSPGPWFADAPLNRSQTKSAPKN